MNVGLHQVPDGVVDHAMARQRRNAAERLGHDAHAEMGLAAGGARVSGVTMTLVLDQEVNGGEPGNERGTQPLGASQGFHVSRPRAARAGSCR